MCRYLNLVKSDSSTIILSPTIVFNSFCSSFITLGCLIRTDRIHSMDVLAVSMAPATISRIDYHGCLNTLVLVIAICR
ncbi:hypothetical protein HanPSC8_Chr08g0326681 [Helianthus annuus]|nr:hypothetical protein HanPSC8_Chr08g0326681 [Helianthus annuus]